MHPRTFLAQARGLPTGAGCRCALCGASPYDPAGDRARVLGPNFVDHDLLHDPSAEQVCTGCASLLAGRPGDDPPPLRMSSLVATKAGLDVVRARDLWAVLRDPPAGPCVVSWAVSGKVHHWLRAGLSSPARCEIGSDRATILYEPARDAQLLDAVHALLYTPTGTAPLLPRRAIASGNYHPKSVQSYGAERWSRHEDVVASYRPSGLLDLVCAASPLHEDHPQEEPDVIDPVDKRAALLLALICEASSVRAEEGKAFWSGFLRHRVERFRRLPLSHFVSRMLDACGTRVTAESTLQLLEYVEQLDEASTSQVEEAIRERPALLVALAYDRIQIDRALKQDGGGA